MNLLGNRLRTTLLLRQKLASLEGGFDAPHVDIDVLEPACVDLLSEINPGVERPLETAKFAAGYTCYVARVDGRPAHYSWVQDSGLHCMTLAARKRRVLEGHLWIHACFTAAWARGRHVYPAVLLRILSEYKSRGFHTAWIYVREGNVASLKGIRRAGFELVSRLRSVSFRGVSIPLP